MFVVAKRLDGSFKMTRGTEVGFDPGDIVLDSEPAPPKRGTAAPHFSAHVLRSSWVDHGWQASVKATMS